MSINGRSRVSRAPVESLETRMLLAANVIYVDAAIADHSRSAVHDGTSWSRAYGDLQSALSAAAATPGPDDVWIAQGTYKPSKVYAPAGRDGLPVVGGNSALNVPNLRTFDLPDGVALYGGFKYGDKTLSKRDPARNRTTLSGDLAGNDHDTANPVLGQANKADNAWHVVTLGNDVARTGVTATLDGLYVVDGYAAGPNLGGTLAPFDQGHSNGGGVYSAFGSHLTINDTVFQYNFAGSMDPVAGPVGDGGGVFSDGSDLAVTASRFLNNSARVRGGALEGLNDFEVGSHTTTITDCDFADNVCQVFGGAIVGEGAYQGPDSSMTITRSTFERNTAPEGGAIVIDTLPVTVDGCTFTANVALVNAGAIATTNVVGTLVRAPNNFATTVTRSSFVGNVCRADPVVHDTFFPFDGINFARGGGALVAYMNGYLNVDSCLFAGNVTDQSDGGAILDGNASANTFGVSAFEVGVVVSNSTFLGNRAPNGNGGAIAATSDGRSLTSTSGATRLSVDGSYFLGNGAGGNGGAIYLASASAKVNGSLFAFNVGAVGGAIYGIASDVNGFPSSDPAALAALLAANTFIANDVVLA